MASRGSVNKVMVLGNLGSDPELRNLPDGSSVVNFSIATTEVTFDKAGQKTEWTEWHRISFFGRPAEVIHEYVRKGHKLYVEGYLRTRKWQDRDGNDRQSTEIRGREFVLLGGRDGSGSGGGGGSSSGGGGGRDSGGGSGAGDSGARNTEDNFGDMDDVPF